MVLAVLLLELHCIRDQGHFLLHIRAGTQETRELEEETKSLKLEMQRRFSLLYKLRFEIKKFSRGQKNSAAFVVLRKEIMSI